MARRTGHEALYSRIVEMDVKRKEQELIEKEVNKFFCEGGAIRCPVCDCQPDETRVEPQSGKLLSAKAVKRKKESAAELCARLGYDEPSEEQKRQNLNDNLDYFFHMSGPK